MVVGGACWIIDVDLTTRSEKLIGLAGFSSDCDAEHVRSRKRHRLDKGVLVSYTFENGTCCLGREIIHRAYHVLEEYTVSLRDGSMEEVKTDRWHNRKPAKKANENTEYHKLEFRYFKPHELTVLSGLRPGDIVQAHFIVKNRASHVTARSRRTEEAVIINVSVSSIAVNFTADHVVSMLPREFVDDPTPTHEEL